MREIIENLLKDHQGHHSNFQIENFIVGCSGDAWAQYKQALREIESRYEIILDARTKLISHKKSMQKIKRSLNGDKRKIKSYGLRVGAYRKELENAQDVKRELKKFVELAVRLKSEIGEVDSKKRQALETKSWKNKGVRMAAVDVLATGAISHQTYDFIFSLPKESQLELFKALSTKKPWELLGYQPDEIRAITKK